MFFHDWCDGCLVTFRKNMGRNRIQKADNDWSCNDLVFMDLDSSNCLSINYFLWRPCVSKNYALPKLFRIRFDWLIKIWCLKDLYYDSGQIPFIPYGFTCLLVYDAHRSYFQDIIKRNYCWSIGENRRMD